MNCNFEDLKDKIGLYYEFDDNNSMGAEYLLVFNRHDEIIGSEFWLPEYTDKDLKHFLDEICRNYLQRLSKLK